MKFVYRGNVLNYHTKPIADELYRLIGQDFCFIIDNPSLKMRSAENDRGDMTHGCSYALNMADSQKAREYGEHLIEECDVLFTLACYCKQFVQRMKKNKVTIFYSERLFKPASIKPYDPRMIANMLWYNRRFRNKRVYMFCASAYLPCDLDYYKSYTNKMYKWGYFVSTDNISWEELKKEKEHDTVSILWIGSLSQVNKWKHLEKMIPVATKIKSMNFDAKIHVIGDGDCRSYFETIVKKENLSNVILFHGNVSNDEVRSFVRKANIFVGTSDYQEGWGAVLNEAMNGGCAVVASHAAGATPYMVEDQKNGVIFDGISNNGIQDMVQQIAELVDSNERRTRLGYEAYQSYMRYWSAEKAAESLLDFCEIALRRDDASVINVRDEGPCSVASVIPQHKMLSKCKEEKDK